MEFDLGDALMSEEKNSIREMLSTATVDRLPEIIAKLAHVQSETERSVYVNELSKKLKISRRSIFKDIAAQCGSKLHGKREENDRIALFPGLVDLVLDENNMVEFLVKNGDGIEVRNSHSIEGKVFFPPDPASLPFMLPRAKSVLHYYKNSDKNLFSDVITFCKRFSFLEFKQWLIIGTYVFLTYLSDHIDVQYFPIVLFHAVPERGKSRTGRTITYISYRGIHVVDLRESNLFRYSGNLGASLFFDIMDVWRKAEQRQSEDILLTRFERGSIVARVLYPERGPFKDTAYFKNFGATVIATNESIHKILGTRCIPLTMPNQPGLYQNPTPEAGLELKERLTAWRAHFMNAALPKVEPIDEITGRLWDISVPLLQVCLMVAPEHYDELVDMLLEVAGQKLEDKKDSLEGFIVAALNELSPKDLGVPWELSTAAILDQFNQDRPEGFKKTPQWIGRKLKALGLATSHTSGRSIVTLDKNQLDQLLVQYGFVNLTANASNRNAENAENAKNESNTGSYGNEDDVPF
jgi:hypothetical protein